MISTSANPTAWGFNFFPPALCARWSHWEKQQPPQIAAHLQARTTRRSNPWLAKELQFCPRTRPFLLYLSFKEKPY
jgi:hypothetical protein